MKSKSIKKVLVANRGEIAVRIIRACRELGISTVAVFSEIDHDSLHVSMADESYCIGPAASSESYLNIQALLTVAALTRADAVHPGYGFLSENHLFADAVTESGFVFIGPPASVIESVGDKIMARQAAIKSQIPVVPGLESVDDPVKLNEFVEKFGLPILIKAAAGGGGKGMRVINHQAELTAGLDNAAREAQAAFGNPMVYAERYFQKVKHVEIQILADNYQNVVSLFERDCSIQRRHQKLIEESPCAILTSELREQMSDYARRIILETGYRNAGTVEFLLDENNNPYFLEVNSRVQVEHPVTEMVTDTDIVKAQILVAEGETLDNISGLKNPELSGAAIEFRINAEDPDNNFMPDPGKIDFINYPGGPGVRFDTQIYSGYTIPVNYDSLIGKLIVRGRSRMEAIARARSALSELKIQPIATTISLHQKIIENKEFVAGNFFTDFLIEQNIIGNE